LVVSTHSEVPAWANRAMNAKLARARVQAREGSVASRDAISSF
jgi:hypothetical protein